MKQSQQGMQQQPGMGVAAAAAQCGTAVPCLAQICCAAIMSAPVTDTLDSHGLLCDALAAAAAKASACPVVPMDPCLAPLCWCYCATLASFSTCARSASHRANEHRE